MEEQNKIKTSNKKKPSQQLTKQFIDGLEEYNITIAQLQSNFKYCGGDSNSHRNYYLLYCKNNDLPKPENTISCICGHRIVENCYITDGTQILVLGNCCIKKFIPKSSRTCEKCGDSHKNRIVNKCNKCRSGSCDRCGDFCDFRYKKCFKCFFN